MPDPYPLRPVTDAEFEPWTRMIADTYGTDRSEREIADRRAATDLTRTIAAFDGQVPVGGASVYRRRLTVPGSTMAVAGVASVGVAPTHRRRGILTSMMRRQLTELNEQQREPVAVLRPSEAGIYERYGYGPATTGNQLICDRRALAFRPGTNFGDGTVRLVDRASARPLVEEVYDTVRAGAVGWPEREDVHWNTRLFDDPEARAGRTALRFAVHEEPDGEVTGYVLYRHRPGEEAGALEVEELAATSRPAHAALWRFLAGIDLVAEIEYEAGLDDPLPHLLVDRRAARGRPVDRLWVRLVEGDRALAGRRYAVEVDLVLEVEDEFCPWNTGRFRLCGDGETATCVRTSAPADLRLTATELGAAFLGGTTLTSLATAGRVREERPGALARASRAFRGEREPFYPGGWAFPLY